MGRKKSEDVSPDRLNLLISNIKEKYGNVISSGDDLFPAKKRVIPISPSLDLALGGGIPEGSWVVVNGPEKLGKSSTLLEFAANAQQEEYGSKEVFYIDVEARLKEMNIHSYKKLNTKKFHRFKSEKGETPLTSERFLNIAEEILTTYPGCILIIDSISALCEGKEKEGGIGTETRGGAAKHVAQFCRQMAQVVNVNDSVVCCVTHSIANTGYGGGMVEKTANALKYQVDVKLKALYREFIYPNAEAEKKKSKPVAQRTEWIMECSALGTPPNQRVNTYIRYGEGLDIIYDYIELGISFGIIEVSGSWLILKFNNQKIQGKENLRYYLATNPDDLKSLENEVKQITK